VEAEPAGGGAPGRRSHQQERPITGATWTVFRSSGWLALVLVGCLALPAPGQVLLSEVRVVQLFDRIVLQNYGAESVDLTGWSLSVSPGLAGPGSVDGWALPAATALPAAKRLTIHWSTDLGDSYRLPTGPGPLARLSKTAGDLALRSPSALEHYVQWGAARQAQEAEAVAAGKWQQGQFLESLPASDGFGYGYDHETGLWLWHVEVIVGVVRASRWAEVKTRTEGR
jgi:hypothetical protein